MMPGMDGISFIKEIRSGTYTTDKDIPIIVLSGASSEKHVEAFKAGANMVLEKPARAKDIRQAVSEFLGPV